MSLGLSSSGYARGDDWEAVRILYAGGALAMTVVLPAEGRLDQVSAAVADGGLTEILAANKPTMVQLTLPKWEFRTQAALADVLTAMGMPTAFDPNAADFSGMTEQEQLYIAAVVHEAFIAVDEEGTEAAAATAVVMGDDLHAAVPGVRRGPAVPLRDPRRRAGGPAVPRPGQRPDCLTVLARSSASGS